MDQDLCARSKSQTLGAVLLLLLFFGHTKILHTLIGMEFMQLLRLAQLRRPEFPARDIEVLKYLYLKQTLRGVAAFLTRHHHAGLQGCFSCIIFFIFFFIHCHKKLLLGMWPVHVERIVKFDGNAMSGKSNHSSLV